MAPPFALGNREEFFFGSRIVRKSESADQRCICFMRAGLSISDFLFAGLFDNLGEFGFLEVLTALG